MSVTCGSRATRQSVSWWGCGSHRGHSFLKFSSSDLLTPVNSAFYTLGWTSSSSFSRWVSEAFSLAIKPLNVIFLLIFFFLCVCIFVLCRGGGGGLQPKAPGMQAGTLRLSYALSSFTFWVLTKLPRLANCNSGKSWTKILLPQSPQWLGDSPVPPSYIQHLIWCVCFDLNCWERKHQLIKMENTVGRD